MYDVVHYLWDYVLECIVCEQFFYEWWVYVEEFFYVKEKLPFVKEIFIQDDTLPKKRAREISSSIIKEGLDLNWSCYCRADMDFETLKMMKDSGCRCLHVGYESGNLQLLKNIIYVRAMEATFLCYVLDSARANLQYGQVDLRFCSCETYLHQFFYVHLLRFYRLLLLKLSKFRHTLFITSR